MVDSSPKCAHVAIFLTSVALLVVAAQGCSTSRGEIVAREAVIADLKPILEIEAQAQTIRQILETARGYRMFDSRAVTDLKEHHDLYYIYHLAATFHLAHGERQQFIDYVELARRELEAIESIMRSAARDYLLGLRKEG